MKPLRWLTAKWRSLSPRERRLISRAWNALVSVVVGILAKRAIRQLLVTGALVGAGSLATVTGSAILGNGGGFRPMNHHNLSSEIGAGSPVARDPIARAAAIAASQAAAKQTTTGRDSIPARAARATQQRGCRTSPVGNYSSRAGARPALLVVHYTVSSNRAGWGDVDAIVRYFGTPSSQASSHWVIDFEGNCAYIVSEQSKAWTQGWFNPWSLSVEFIATGKETVWPEPALRKGALVFADAAKRWGIPIRPALVDGCKVVSSGITDHEALGCGNSHTDVKPYFPMAKFIRYVKEAAGPAAPRPPLVRRPYTVCSWKTGPKPACANAVRAGEAVELRLRRGAQTVTVRRR